MLFQPQLARLVLNGRKTTTRRLVKPGQDGAAPRSFYRTGRDYPLERPMRLDEANERQAAIITRRARGRPPRQEIGRVLITSVERGPLGEILFADARAEGFDTPRAFKEYWIKLHDRWPRPEKVFCPACLLDADYPADELPPCPTCGGDAELPLIPNITTEGLAERWRERWATVEVWILNLQVQPTTYYLAANAITAGGDYVTTERDHRGNPIAMTTEVDVTAAEPGSLRGANHTGQPASHCRCSICRAQLQPGLHRVPEEAVPPTIIDEWTHDENSAHRRLQDSICAQGHTLAAHQRTLDRQLIELDDRVRDAKKTASRNAANIAAEIKAFRDAQKRSKTLEHQVKLVETIEAHAKREEVSHAA